MVFAVAIDLASGLCSPSFQKLKNSIVSTFGSASSSSSSSLFQAEDHRSSIGFVRRSRTSQSVTFCSSLLSM
uniref:Uncharacterized protein n=1 Tax=Leersia perrieri TaxID=77586 RepID=A0A0D9WQ45_9ORYZ